MIDLAYGLFMAEAEGYLGPNSEKISSIITDANRLIKMGETVAVAIIEAAALNDVDYNSLTKEEIQRIRQAL